jgi:hypothetical protein
VSTLLALIQNMISTISASLDVKHDVDPDSLDPKHDMQLDGSLPLGVGHRWDPSGLVGAQHP